MRIFGSERLDSMLQKLGLEEGESITHPWVSKALERAQQKVEARNYDIRKHLLKYDDVMNDQRKVIYELRRDLMSEIDAQESVEGMRLDVIDDLVAKFIPEKAYAEKWEAHSLHEESLRIFSLDLPIADWVQEEGIAEDEIKQRITDAVSKLMQGKESEYGSEVMREVEKSLLLRILDHVWKDHLHSLDHLRQGINLRAYAQRNPLNEYKNEAFSMFETMLVNLRETVTGALCHLNLGEEVSSRQVKDTILQGVEPSEAILLEHPSEASTDEIVPGGMGGLVPGVYPDAPVVKEHNGKFNIAHSTPHLKELTDPEDPSTWGQVKRNDPCPCESGKRFKHCHGRNL